MAKIKSNEQPDSPNMLIRDRQEKLIELVNDNGRISITELLSCLNVSESTLRRDLAELQQKGLIKLVRGGAESISAILGRGEELLDKRYSLFSNEKSAIGEYAAGLIKPGDFVFIDSGSTTEKMCEFIQERNAIYITIGLKQVMLLSRKGLNANIAPGRVKQMTEGLNGSYTLDFLTQFNFTLAFIGALGITAQGGVSTIDYDDALIKRTVLKHSARSFVLTDPSKFGMNTAVKICELPDISIITSKQHEQDLSEYSKLTSIIEV